jgi:type I restriction enzyme M protein
MTVTVNDIFRDDKTKHSLTIFSLESIQEIEDMIFDKSGKPYIKCLASDKERPAKPEEIIRQLWLRRIIEDLHYPKERIKVEKAVWFGSGVSEKAADIVIMHIDGEHPYIIFEVKKPKRKDGLQQLKSYCNADGSSIGVWSNGGETVILHREEPNIFSMLTSIPTVDQTLQDVVTEQWTIEKLNNENKLVREKLSLKKIILDLEDLVLANAEGIDDSFDEVFKLIYAKLYDEWAATNDIRRNKRINFRIYGESPDDLYVKINGLFDQAKNKWRGVFSLDDKIKLKPGHLLTCVSFLQDVKLFNANLQVIDEAFEYLVTEVAKGKKGQYFTPRWVIDMCVKMLNPKITEKIIDPACGSAGFTVHSIFWVAGNEFTANVLPPHMIEFVRENVYGIDSSPRAVKISKALNLIAGDGKTNIYELNSLNSPKWNDEGKSAFRPMLTRFLDNPELDQDNQKNFRYFDFDVLLTNPPFAGNINEREILKQYQLAERNGKSVSKIGRDILFIEKCLNFLKPGGRCAIVLPQGRLNNSSDLHIRKFIFDKARLLAVVGLGVNTFKPHTGTKTSVIFLQKYTYDELEEIRNVISTHEEEWEVYLGNLESISKYEEINEDKLDDNIITELSLIFDEPEEFADVEDEEGEKLLDEEELTETINELEEQFKLMVGRAKGKTTLQKKILELKMNKASCSLKGRLNWFLNDQKSLERYKSLWLNGKASNDLDYPIFFAVSDKPGKDNSGEPIFKKDEHGELILDKHGHLVIDHDLDEIAEAFKEFSIKKTFDFWVS